MDTQERNRVFTELMTSMELYDTGSDEPVILSLSGLSDKSVREAVIAQACRQDDRWVMEFCMGLTRAYMNKLAQAHENEHKADIDNDALAGIGIAIYLSWLNGQVGAVMKLITLIGMVLEDIKETDAIGFLHRIFAPPPVAVCIKNAYLNLDSLKIINEAQTNVFDDLMNYVGNLDMAQVRDLMSKEGYSMDNTSLKKPKFVDEMFDKE